MGSFTNFGFSVISHRQPRHRHHGQIVRPISHGDSLLRRYTQSITGGQYHAALFFAIADVAPCLVNHASRQLTVFDFKHIAAGEINTQNVPHTVGEKGEAAADQKRFQPRVLAGLHQGLGARV